MGLQKALGTYLGQPGMAGQGARRWGLNHSTQPCVQAPSGISDFKPLRDPRVSHCLFHQLFEMYGSFAPAFRALHGTAVGGVVQSINRWLGLEIRKGTEDSPRKVEALRQYSRFIAWLLQEQEPEADVLDPTYWFYVPEFFLP